MKWSFPIGRIRGIEIRGHLLLVLLIPYAWLMTRSDGLEVTGRFLLFLTGLFVSIGFHEMGHTLVARRYGIQVSSITLWPLGGFTVMSREPTKPRQTFLLTLAGPLMNLLLAGLFWLISLSLLRLALMAREWETGSSLLEAVFTFSRLMAVGNLALALLNLLPLYPLDGGRMTRATLQALLGPSRADLIVLIISLPLATALALFGLWQGDVLLMVAAVLLGLGAATLNPRAKAQIELGWAYVLDRGMFYYRRGDYDRAIAWYTDLLQRRSNHPKAHLFYNNRAIAYLKMNDIAAARADLDQGIQLAPNLPLCYVNRGLAAYLMGDLAQASTDYEHAIQLRPDSPHAYANLALIRRDQGDCQAALADLDHALEIDPNNPDVYIMRSMLRYRIGASGSAYDDCDRAIELSPSAALIQDEVSLELEIKGHLDWALAFYKRAIQKLPRSSLPYQGRADAYRVNGELSSAITDYTRAIELSPRRAECYLGRGRAYQQQGDTTRAVADYEKVVTLSDKLHLQRQAKALLNNVGMPLTAAPPVKATLSAAQGGTHESR